MNQLTGVHGKQLVITKELACKLLKLAQNCVMKRSRSQSDLARLLTQCLDDTRMTVTLIYCTIGAQEVVIAFAIDIPHEHAVSLFNGDWQRMVVVSTISILSEDDSIGGRAYVR